jgi:hypothetical protein
MTRRIFSTALFTLVGSVTWSAAQVPVAVSPAGEGEVSLVADRCPTFSWGSVEGAAAYELAVLEAPGETAGSRFAPEGERVRAGMPVAISQVIPAAATSWTPSLGRCLRPGGTYAWAVRERGEYGRPDGEWSEWTIFEIAGASAGEPDRSSARIGSMAGGGTGGIPAVQAQLDDIQRQIADNQAKLEELINERLDTIEANLFACTPQKLAAGECDDNHPLDIEVTICGDIGVVAAVSAAFSVNTTYHAEIGMGWSLVADVAGNANIDLPFVATPFPPLIFPVPDVELAGQAAGGLTLQGCLSGIRLPLGVVASSGLDATSARVVKPGLVATSDDVDPLIAAMQAGGEELLATAREVIENLDLTPHQVARALGGLQDLHDPTVSIEDRLVFFEGPLRDLVDTLPVGGRVQTLLDDPGLLVPDLPNVLAGGSCNDLKNEIGLPELDPFFDQICGATDPVDLQTIFEAFNFIDDIHERAKEIERVVGKIKDVVDSLKP